MSETAYMIYLYGKERYIMKKKIITSAIAAAAVFMSTAAFAANPSVVLNNRVIDFEDQPAVITDEGRTLVPVRGVFEKMGARVDWFEADRSIAVVTKDSLTKIVLKVDDSVMKVRHFTGLMDYTEEQFTLDAAPRIMNDRTMIPLRVISEALGCDVQWDGETYTVTINTEKKDDSQQTGGEKAEDKRIKMSLSADKTDVNAGDEIKVFVNAENVADKNIVVTGAASRVLYDKTKFEYVGFSPIIEGAEKEALSAVNPDYNENSVKGVYVTIDSKEKMKDGAVMVYTFKALTDEGGEFKLSNAVSTVRGNDTSLSGQEEDGTDVSYKDDKELFIDTTPLAIK